MQVYATVYLAYFIWITIWKQFDLFQNNLLNIFLMIRKIKICLNLVFYKDYFCDYNICNMNELIIFFLYLLKGGC